VISFIGRTCEKKYVFFGLTHGNCLDADWDRRVRVQSSTGVFLVNRRPRFSRGTEDAPFVLSHIRFEDLSKDFK